MIARILTALRERLQSLRYLLGDLAYLLARPFRALGRGIAQRWESLSVVARRRIAASIGLIAAAATVVYVIAPNLPCAFPGGDACAPGDDAAEIVPADALVYVHANLDPDSDQYAKARAIAARTPLLTPEIAGRLLALVPGAAGQAPDFAADIQPWFGGEVALAQIPGSAGTQQVALFEAADTDGALAYADSLSDGEVATTDVEGIELREDSRGLASAVVDGFLALGPVDSVRSVIETAKGAEGADALVGEDAADQAFDALPESRVADVYFSAEGIDSNLALTDGPLSPLEPLVDSGGSTGAAMSVSAEDDGFSFAVRSILDPDRDEDARGFFAAFDQFDPALDAELPSDTLAYFGLGNASETVGALLDQATVRAPGIAQGVADLVDRLRSSAGIDLESELLPALGGEGALAVVPAQSEPDAPAADSTPNLEFLADQVDEEAARDALARLQGPIADLVDPELGTPGFDQRTIGDIDTQILQLSVNSVLAYAAFDSKLLIANATAPFESMPAEGEGLDSADNYEAATDGLAEEPSFIAYLDVASLLAYFESEGLAQDTAYGAFAPDLRLLRTLAVTVESSDGRLGTDARLRIAAP
jgi:hypothetical protein